MPDDCLAAVIRALPMTCPINAIVIRPCLTLPLMPPGTDGELIHPIPGTRPLKRQAWLPAICLACALLGLAAALWARAVTRG